MHRLLLCLACLPVLTTPVSADSDWTPALCDMGIREEQVELDDARLEVELFRIDLAAFEEIFTLIDGLHEAEAVDELTFLRARYDRDAARLALTRGETLVARQAAVVAQWVEVCDESRGASRKKPTAAFLGYLESDCDQQARAVDVARTNLEFNTAWRDSVLELRRGDVATRQDVILAERDVSREQQALADANRREAECRDSLEKLRKRQ